jgi:putative ABC transport system permease protein
MNTIASDFSYAFRQIARQRAFSAIVIATLALGIGATTTFFSILNAFVFRPLTFRNPDRLVALQTFERPRSASSAESYASVLDLARSTPVLRSAIGYASRDVNATGAEGSERTVTTAMSGDLLGLLGASFSIGRPFLAEEHRSHAAVAVISHTFWTRHYAADSAVIGRTVLLDGAAHDIVGVAPEGFVFPDDTDVWVLLDERDAPPALNVVARLQDGVSIAQANGALAGAAVSVEPANGRPSSSLYVGVVGLREWMIPSKQRGVITVMLLATVFVLLIACANLAGLLAAHLGSRRQEIAVRTALGARRSRIVTLLLIESAVLALIGGAFGILVAQWGIDLFAGTLGKPQGQGWLNFAIDGRVLMFAFAASLATALLFGLLPAIGATRLDLRGVLLEDAHAVGVGRRGRRLRVILVATQMAVSLGFIAAASSIVLSSEAFETIDPGFDRVRLAVLHVTLAGTAYDSPATRMAFVDAATERIAALPGVAGVSATSHLPLADRVVPASRVEFEGADPNGTRRVASLRFVASSYAATVGLPIRRGRSFSVAEAADPRTPLLVINETMRRRYWPDADPLGQRVRLPDSPYGGTWLTIVGVVGDVSQRNPGDDPQNQIYLPLAHSRDISFVVRASHDAGSIVLPARRALAAVDGTLPVNARTYDDVRSWFVRDRTLQGFVLGSVGLVALLLAALGTYAVMTLLVSHERREFAIRIALGSSNQAIHRLVIGRSLRVAAAGILGGLILAGIMTSLLSSVFFGVRPFDPRIMMGAVLLLAATALFASWWPARRAMKVDPMTVLRS